VERPSRVSRAGPNKPQPGESAAFAVKRTEATRISSAVAANIGADFTAVKEGLPFSSARARYRRPKTIDLTVNWK